MSAVFSRDGRRPKTRCTARAWKKMLATRGKRDLYVIEQAAGLTFVQGTFPRRVRGQGQGADQARHLETELREGGTRRRTSLLQFTRRRPGILPAAARERGADRVPRPRCVRQLAHRRPRSRSRPPGVTVTTVAGATIKYPSTAALAKLDYALGNIAYLSDLQPQVEGAGRSGGGEEAQPRRSRSSPTGRSPTDTLKLDNKPFREGAVRRAGHRADVQHQRRLCPVQGPPSASTRTGPTPPAPRRSPSRPTGRCCSPRRSAGKDKGEGRGAGREGAWQQLKTDRRGRTLRSTATT